MQRKDLALRVLSTAAIMSIVTSIAAPAFADIYYIGKGSIDVETVTDESGKQYVKVTQGGTTYQDESKEIVIKDGTSEADTTLTEAKRAAGTQATPAVAPATQELEATGTADAAGESQPDPDAGFTLNETGEDSAQNQEGNNPTENPTEDTTDNHTEDTKDNPTEPPKKDVVYEYAPADPNPEQQATKLAPTTSAAPTAKTNEAALANAPTTTTSAQDSAPKPTPNVIKVVNNWVGKATKELKIRLSNVNIKSEWPNAAMDVSGDGTTKVELDGQNVLDSSSSYQAGLRKQGGGTLIITDETDNEGKKITTSKLESDTSGSLTAKGGDYNGAAGIGGSIGESTKNITIEGYATVNATGGGSGGAGIGGGGGNGQNHEQSGDAENIIIQGHSKVTATALNGAAIGGGSPGGGKGAHGGSARRIVICDHATVIAKGSDNGRTGNGAAIGAAGLSGDDTEATVIIGTAGATDEDVRIIATGVHGSAIGNGRTTTNVTIQGHVTIQTASSHNYTAIGSGTGNVTVNITDNVTIDTVDEVINEDPGHSGSSIGGGSVSSGSNRKVEVNINGGDNGKVKIGENRAILGSINGAISGTTVNIGNNVLLKMKQKQYWNNGYDYNNPYINVNGAEAEVGTRSDHPGASGLVNSIGDNTELWYFNIDNKLQKIVHGKNLCKKSPTEHIKKEPTCTAPGSADYTCDYENGAAYHSCNRTWTDELPALGHDWKDNGDANHICDRDNVTAAHTYGKWTTVKEATCTTAGKKKHTCTECGHVETQEIPATGHHWKDNGDGTHTCPDCGATEGQPVNTNSALELRVVDAEGMDQPFTVSQNGTLRTYTGAYDTATLTGDLDTLRYLQDHGAQTIQFVTNGQTSSFSINDLLAQGSGSEVFYLTHRGAEEPTLLLVEADHSELVKD